MSDDASFQSNSFYGIQEEITLTRNGEWLSNGEEITHEATCRMFARHLKRDEQGYFIQVQYETKRITVEDTPYFVVALRGDDGSGYTLILNDGTSEPLIPENLRYQPERLTYFLARDEEAKFLRAPYFELLGNIKERDGRFAVQIGNVDFYLT